MCDSARDTRRGLHPEQQAHAGARKAGVAEGGVRGRGRVGRPLSCVCACAVWDFILSSRRMLARAKHVLQKVPEDQEEPEGCLTGCRVCDGARCRGITASAAGFVHWQGSSANSFSRRWAGYGQTEGGVFAFLGECCVLFTTLVRVCLLACRGPFAMCLCVVRRAVLLCLCIHVSGQTRHILSRVTCMCLLCEHMLRVYVAVAALVDLHSGQAFESPDPSRHIAWPSHNTVMWI